MMRASPPRAVVFDLDGTLLDSLTLVLQAMVHAVTPFGGRPTMDIFARLGGPPGRFLGPLLDDVKNLPVAMERMEAFHRENAHLIQPYAGAAALLDDLRARDIAVAIWTGRDRLTTEWLLREHALEDHFATVVCGDDLSTHKPDPEGLRTILRRLDVPPSQTIFVGDADVDVLGGVSCGVDTLLIRHARAVSPQIAGAARWCVGAPQEAFALVRACIQTVKYVRDFPS